MNLKYLKLFFSLASIFSLAAFLFLAPITARAAGITASSSPSLLVNSESELDFDGDGYSDADEIKNGYSPFNPEKVKLTQSDMDSDGLSDYWELKFKTEPFVVDSDGDGYQDGTEIDFGYNPLASSSVKLSQKIQIDLAAQKLIYLVGGQPWKEFIVSSGKPSMPTTPGNYKIINKISKAWSNTYKLWMPYWLGLDRGQIGIHELPVWPSGYREGTDHLGKPVSHGCVRLGIGPAEYIYDRVSKGTEVVIK
ncbi:MAG: L,D-transpeptidase [Patescibacteria group bacterium]|jgi:lipoprotein-anchoring transpeptidase ErfK/SrfK